MYLAAVSLIAVIMTVSDKSRAKKHKRRIAEKTLFGTAILGGSAAMYLTMLAIRHKTTKADQFTRPQIVVFADCTGIAVGPAGVDVG